MTPPTTIQLSSIKRDERARTQYNGIEELAESIRDRGLIQPIVIQDNFDGTYTLAAGGRRCKAIESLGITELHSGLTGVPCCAGFVELSNLPEDERLEIELEENLYREDFTWQDRARFVCRIHRLKKTKAAKQSESWGYRQTGELLGSSLGDINNCLLVGAALESGRDFTGCNSITDALRLLLKDKTDQALKLQVQANLGAPSSQAHSAASSFFGDDSLDLDPITPQSRSSDEQNKAGEAPAQIVDLSKQFRQGDCLKLMADMPEGLFDHIVCDPPYGIDMDNLELVDQQRIEDEHEVAENLTLLDHWIPLAFKVLRDKGFCILWCDVERWDFLAVIAKNAGFKVQRWPITWCKMHPCRNQAASYNFTKNTEVAMVLRKGNATLIKPQPSTYILADGSIERKLYNNPFAKPFEVWKFIMEAIAHKGQSVYDPFAGEFSSCRAAVNLGLVPFGSELVERHFNKGIENIKETYKLLLRDGVKFK